MPNAFSCMHIHCLTTKIIHLSRSLVNHTIECRYLIAVVSQVRRQSYQVCITSPERHERKALQT